MLMPAPDDFHSVPLPGVFNGATDLTLVLSNSPAINIDNLGGGSCNPVQEDMFYYVHLTKYNTGLNPVLLVSISGCYFLQVYGVIRGEEDESVA